MTELDPTTFRPETRALHAGQKADPATNARAVPIYATTSYVFDDAAHAARLFGLQEFGNIYTRIMNPTTDVFEQRVAALEGGVAALGVASGQAAETLTILNLARAGDNIVSIVQPLRRHLQPVHPYAAEDRHHDDLRRRLRPDGVRARDRRAGPRPSSSSSSATRGWTSTTWPRSPTWPTPGACRSSSTTRSRRSWPSRSSTAPTSSSTRATKWIGGHGTAIGGVVVDGGTFDWAARRRFKAGLRRARPVATTASATRRPSATSRSSSSCASRACATSAPRSARSTRSCSCRASRRCRCASPATARTRSRSPSGSRRGPRSPGSAIRASSRTRRHKQATKYLKGGFGGIVTFGVKGGVEAGRRLIDNVQIFTLLANVGDAKSLIIHPASTTHSQLEPEEQVSTGVTPDLVRLSVGLEHVDDLIADLERALAAATAESPDRGELVGAAG